MEYYIRNARTHDNLRLVFFASKSSSIIEKEVTIMSKADKIYTIGIAIFGVIVVGYVVALSISYLMM